MKIETITLEYEKCGECPQASGRFHGGVIKWTCLKTGKKIPSLWHKPIPKWCPLEDKK